MDSSHCFRGRIFVELRYLHLFVDKPRFDVMLKRKDPL